MNYNNTSNQNNKKDYVSTNAIRFYGEKCSMALGFTNDFVSLRYNPLLANPTQTNKYDYDVNLSTMISYQNLTSLVYGINADIIPSIKEGGKAAVAVSIGGNNLVNIATDGGKVAVSLFRDIDPETMKPKQGMTYHFAESTLIKGYDESTGQFDKVNTPLGEFASFAKFLETSLEGLTMVNAHASRYVDRFFRNLIASKSGGNTSGGSSYKSNNDVFGGSGNSSSSNNSGFNQPADNTSISSMSDLDSFMNS